MKPTKEEIKATADATRLRNLRGKMASNKGLTKAEQVVFSRLSKKEKAGLVPCGKREAAGASAL